MTARSSPSLRVSFLRLAIRLGVARSESVRDVRSALEVAGVRTSLFVCAMPRTGSNLLDGLLASTGLVGEPAEDFGDVYETQILPVDGRTGLADHVALCAGRAGSTGVHAVKLHLHQHDLFLHLLRLLRGSHGLTDAELIEAAFPQPRYVWLRRNDVVAQAVSWWRASQSGVWIDSDTSRFEPVFDFAGIDTAVMRTRHQVESWRQWFNANGIEPLAIAYEDIVAAPQRVVREILTLAGVDIPAQLVVSPRIAKQADSLSETWIERYRLLAGASSTTHSA